MILYYPVSALVTLFANILQNPQDARARSDIRLMNQVVGFLELLAVDEETGGVKRMLNVCSEFERIAKVVLDKADKESHSRRKRKNNKDDPEADKSILPEKRPLPRTPESVASTLPKTPNFLSADFNGGEIGASFNPSLNTFSSPPSSKGELPITEYTGMPAPADFPTILNGGTFTDFGDMQGFPNGGIPSPLNNMGSFQQPFVPQDLWQMPMTLEWDWADMSGTGQFAGFDASGGDPTAGLMNGANGVQTNGQHAGYNAQ